MSESDRPLTPEARIKSEAAPGEAVTLCDGQDWTLATPTIEGYRFKRDDAGAAYLTKAYDPPFEALIDRYFAAGLDADASPVEQYVARFEIAAHLLRRNHDLTEHEASMLLRLKPGDEANEAMWDAILDIAFGREKKVSASGSASSSSPTESATS